MTTEVNLIGEAERSFQRSTSSRRSIMSAVSARSGHFSAEEIHRDTPGASRATVYRTLVRLQQLGVVCRVPVDGEGLRYRLGGTRHHHHLVCIECGDVQDITGCGVDDFVEVIAQRFDYEVASHRLEVYGRCGACRSTTVAVG
ncbi:MAG: transcriptional repressor [Chloroflexi bacterium]|nr:transcriptional repressor [Chloroflexota bacterium]